MKDSSLGAVAQEAGAALTAVALYGSGLSASWYERLARSACPAAAPARRYPVLLVHGVWHNRSWSLRLDRALAGAGWARHSINYRTVGVGIAEAGRDVAAEVRALAESCGVERVHVVAHSLGGIVVREAVTRNGAAAHLASVTTLGSPHQGSLFAGVVGRLPYSRVIAEVAPHSAYLRGLDADTTATPGLPWCAVYSPRDQVVPGHGGRLDHPALHARNIEFPRLGHVSLTVDPRVNAVVLEALTEAEDRVGSRSLC